METHTHTHTRKKKRKGNNLHSSRPALHRVATLGWGAGDAAAAWLRCGDAQAQQVPEGVPRGLLRQQPGALPHA